MTRTANLSKDNWHYGGHPKAICKFVEVPPLWMEGGHVEKSANAALISAAPELVEALENVMEYLETDDMCKLDMNIARAALAKAYGEVTP